MKTLIFSVAMLGLYSVAHAQTPLFERAYGINPTTAGPTQSNGVAVSTDPQGNVYQAGFLDGVMDFDPGPGTYNLDGANGNVYVKKSDASGKLLWVKQYQDNSAAFKKLDIVSDLTGVYIASRFSGTVDFDPGAGVQNRTSAGSYDVYVLCLRSTGDYLGVYTMGGTGADRAQSITVRNSLLYVTGVFSGTFDADPRILYTSTLSSNGGTDVFIVRLSTSGGFSWARGMGGPINDEGTGISVNPSNGDVYTVGSFSGTADLDPTGGALWITSVNFSDMFVNKLTTAGAFQWTKTGTFGPRDVVADASGNVYTAGLFTGTVDFNPDPLATNNISSASATHSCIQKLDASGNYVWATHTGSSTMNNMPNSIILNPDGELYMTGEFSNTAGDFDPGAGSFPIPYNGGQEMYVTGIDVNGTMLWAYGIGGTGHERGYSVAYDGYDGIYVTGDYASATDFNPAAGSFSLPAAGFVNSTIANAFLVKFGKDCPATFYDPPFDWVTTEGNTSAGSGMAVTTDDASGDVYTVGYFSGTVDFDPGAGTFNMTAAGLEDIFIQKTDASGNFIWARQAGGPNYERAQALAIAPNGDVLVTGYFNATVDFDPGTGTVNLTSAGGDDIFVLRLDASGNYIWATRNGGTGHDRGQGIDLDAAGNVHTVGYFSGTVDFDPSAAVLNLVSVGSNDIFVQKLNGSGGLVWAKNIGGISSDIGRGIVCEAGGIFYITGSFADSVDFNPDPGSTRWLVAPGTTTDAFAGRYRTDGSCIWAVKMGGSSQDEGLAIAYSSDNLVYVTGIFRSTAVLGDNTFTSLGAEDIFVQQLTNTGYWGWSKQIGGFAPERAQGISTDDCGDVYLTGYYQNVVDFDPGAGVFNLPYSGVDVFIEKLRNTGAFLWAKQVGGIGSQVGYGIHATNDLSVYTTGYFNNTTDFDPDPSAAYNISGTGGTAIFTLKLQDGTPRPDGNTEAFGNEEQPVADVRIFPNPGNGLFTVNINGISSGSLEVLDMTGKRVYQTSLQNSEGIYQFDLSGFAKGIYVVNIRGEQEVYSRKIVLQ
ncbi:MAG: T9SS type A sorting domain-containing protein [Bacteroidia bacterium]|nr:T9SS type A sorting domain-containing protein [Bacteroidia bacterium]